MSDTATSWAKANPCRSINPRTGEMEADRNAKHVLTDMASYADVEGYVWAAVPVLAIECDISERMVQRGIAALLKAGMLETTDRQHLWRGKWFPIYRMPLEKGFPNTRARLAAERAAERAGAAGVTPVSPHDGDAAAGTGDAGVTRRGDADDGLGVTPVSPLYLKDPIELPTDSPKTGARAGEDGNDGAGEGRPDPFDAVLAEWLAAEVAAKAGRTSPDAARAAWRAAAGDVGPDRLAVAARAALATDTDFRRRGPPALERWLGRGLFSAWLSADRVAGPGEASGGGLAVTVPAEVFEAVAGVKDAAFATSWLSRSSWDEGERVLTVPPLPMKTLRTYGADRALAAINITLKERAS